MIGRGRNFLAALLLVFLLMPAGLALAVQPDEVLSDPAMEERARDLSAQLRCMVCQNQSIDDSDADLARDLRILVRERIRSGDTNAEVLDYIVSRYGEFVLLKPRFSVQNALLWATPLLVLVGGGLLAFVTLRQRSRPERSALSAEEEAELRGILNDRE